jgi:hypothetical protein
VKHFYLIPFLLLAAGCAPDTYRPPIQRKPLLGPEAHLGSWVNMNDAMADAFIVRDISRTTENGAWRWAYRHPQLRFYLKGIQKLRFVADVGVAESTFQETGPVSLSIRINEHDLDTVRFDHAGDRHIDKPVPAGFLQSGAENFVSFETDKQWVSKEDGAVLSFVLTRAGFMR